jgi:hypothetical protein
MSFNFPPKILLTSLSAVVSARSANSPEVGDRMWYEGKEYIYVYNEGTTQASPGYGLTPVAASATSPYTCTVSSNSGSPLVGVVYNATLTTATYGWVVSKGTVPVLPGASYAVGTPLTLDLNGVFVTAIVTAIHCHQAIATVTGVTGTATSAHVYGNL